MTDTLERLTSLLDRERRALRDGDLSLLASLVEEKTTLADRMESEPPGDPAQMRAIAARLEEHGHLIKAAGDGVRDVLTRLAAQRRAREGLNTYDRNGRGSTISGPRAGTERRF